jgi:lysozyme
MSDSRNEPDFRLPPKPRTLLSSIVSALSTPVLTRGVDLSHWNGDVDFVALKASGIEFVILKATEGIGFVDEKFVPYWQSAHALDMPIMTYHFFRFNYGGFNQAKHHVNTLRDTGFLETVGYTSPIMWADVETEDDATLSQRQHRLLAFHETVTTYGHRSGHYSSPYLWGNLIGDVPWADEYCGWNAHWTSAEEPTLPVGWTKNSTKIWQYGIYPTHSWVEPVQGVPGRVDCNWFYGSLQNLKDWLGIVPSVDCCEELSNKISVLEKELVLLKARADAQDLWDKEQDAKISALGLNDANKEARLSDIEILIQSIKDTICS